MADETLDYSVKLLETIAKLKDRETGCDVELVSSVCVGFFKIFLQYGDFTYITIDSVID